MPEKSARDDFSVSVIIPAYNVEKYIARAIDSVLAQTRRADEIIVVDDGSTDGTAGVVEQYGSQVKYITHQANMGLSAARNTGIIAATSQWIAFLDGDDMWLPENLQRQLALLERNPDLVWSGCNYIAHSCRDGSQTICPHGEIINNLLNGKEFVDSFFSITNAGVVIVSCGMMVKRKVFDRVGLFRVGLRYAEDIDMWWRIAYSEEKFGYLNQALAVYYQGRAESLTAGTDQRKIVKIVADLFERHLELAEQSGKKEDIKPYINQKLRKWTYIMYRQKQFDMVGEVITRFDKLLPRGYKTVMRFLTRLPYITTLIGKRLLRLLHYDH
jgi:glycosyltransferase involved in cell wall biosynthesis